MVRRKLPSAPPNRPIRRGTPIVSGRKSRYEHFPCRYHGSGTETCRTIVAGPAPQACVGLEATDSRGELATASQERKARGRREPGRQFLRQADAIWIGLCRREAF